MEEQEQDETTKIKLEINNLLWMRLPGSTTLDEAEVIAMEMHDMVCNPKDFLRREKKRGLME